MQVSWHDEIRSGVPRNYFIAGSYVADHGPDAYLVLLCLRSGYKKLLNQVKTYL